MIRALGSRVRTTVADPAGHHRLPRYLRGQPGWIDAIHGGYPLADSRARGEDDAIVETLYTVAFVARDLWGETRGEGDIVCAELWESYLEDA